MNAEEMNHRGRVLMSALNGLDGPRAFDFILAALATVMKQAPPAQQHLLAAKAMGLLMGIERAGTRQ